MSQQLYPLFSFDYKFGTITILLPSGKRYVFSSPGGHHVFDKWQREIKAHPANGWRLFRMFDKFVSDKTPNWQQLEPEPATDESPIPAPEQLTQGELF
jgi:hypothetical protein